MNSFSRIDKNITKAETLNLLKQKSKLFKVENLFYFTVDQWVLNPHKIIHQIQSKFNEVVIVRSSALDEDSYDSFSSAGVYESVLNINSLIKNDLVKAIEKVILSYRYKSSVYNIDKFQILIQDQTKEVTFSGVFFDFETKYSAPYYVINYDTSGSTNTVTSGFSNLQKIIFHKYDTNLIESHWNKLIQVYKTISEILDRKFLDIEFAINDDMEIIIFQVRCLYLKNLPINFKEHNTTLHREIDNYKKNHLDNKDTYLSDMAFWNPSEIIGDSPHELDYSLYEFLITSQAWNKGISKIGFTKSNNSLMVKVGLKPYIKLDETFKSLLPANLKLKIRKKLIKIYNNFIFNNPEYHDKVEYEIIDNVYLFNKDIRKEFLCLNGVTEEEMADLFSCNKEILVKVVSQYDSLVIECENLIDTLSKNREKLLLDYSKIYKDDISKKINIVKELLLDVRNDYAPIFSMFARMAFMGIAIIKNSIQDKFQVEKYLRSIKTVTTDYLKAKKQQDHKFLLREFGHLRPGTYDITQLPYKLMHYELNQNKNLEFHIDLIKNNKSNKIKNNIMLIFDEHILKEEINFSSKDLEKFISGAIRYRELIKLEFTKNISEALEIISDIGVQTGFSREELSNLNLNDLFENNIDESKLLNIKWKSIINERKTERKKLLPMKLPPVLYSKNNFYEFNNVSSKPNYITHKKVSGIIESLDNIVSVKDINLEGKIVLIEKADPGYDWIFSHNIIGLITKYGGVSSHMAIRCNELGISAAIGCGDVLYEQILKCSRVVLDPLTNKIDML